MQHESEVDEAERRVKKIFERLHLELHPAKTKKVELSSGTQGFDFLGCHLHKRMSGRLWERERKRVYFLQRWPSTKSMKRVKQRVKELTPRGACHEDLRAVIGKLSPVRRGWGNYFRTGNANSKSTRSTATSGGAYASSCGHAKVVIYARAKWVVGRGQPSTNWDSTSYSELSVTQVSRNCRALNDHR